MRKILSIFAAALFALCANAAVINITNETPDALRLALNNAANGDEIVMAAGTYVESNENYIAFAGKHVTVKAAEGAEVLIQPKVSVQVTEGGCAHFVNVKFDASHLNDLADWYEHLIYPADANANNSIILDGCELYGFNLNKSMLYCSGSNVLGAITINNCQIHNCMKSVLFVENTSAAINAQVTNSTFADIATNTESYWAGIIDIRNANANLLVDHCTFYNVIPMNTDYSCVSKITLANGAASNCIFMLPTAQDGIRAMRGVTATNCITFNYLKDNGTGIHSSVTQNNCVQVDPLFVNAAEGNFTLGENSPALTMNDGQPIGDPRWVPAVAPAHTYTVAGSSADLFGTAWDPTNTANDMVLQEDNTYKWEKTDLTLAAGSVSFKVCEDHAWDVAYPAQDYVMNIAEAGIYTIQIYYNPADNNYVGHVATKTGDAVVIPTIAMHGNFLGSWADTENFAVAEGDETASLTLTLAAGSYEFGMRIGGSGNWTSNGVAFTRENNSAVVEAGQGNLTLAADAAGDYVFTWTFATNTLAITFPEAVGPTLENGFYLVGNFNAWTPAAEYHLVGNPANPVEFMVSATLAENDSLKVVNIVNDQITAWYPTGDNYVVDAAHAGEKVVYFMPDYQEAWGGYIYIEANEAPVDEWAEIAFSAPATADEIAADASFTVDGFTVAITDPDNKMSIDANDCRFGTATDYKMYSHRLKSGGKSSATKNFMTLTIPEAGTLRIAVRTGSNSATDRNLVLKQGDDTLYNQVIVETMAVKVMEGETEVSVYPFVEVPVEAGTVALSYPVNGLNFYAFAFKAEGGETPVVLEAPDAAPADPTYPANQVHAMYSATYNADCAFGEWGSGTQVTQEEFGKKYVTTQLGYFGMEFPAGVDCSNMEALHLDVWSANDFSLRVVPIHGGTEVGKTVNIEGQKWNAIDIPLTEFVGVENWSNVIQIKIDEARGVTFWLNNVYFYTTQEQFTYTVAGSSAAAFGTTWDPANAENDMVRQGDGTYKWEKTNIELAEGEIAFKVCENHAWTHAWPAQDYKLAIPEGGLYTVTITFNPAAEADKVAANATKTGEAVVLPTVILHGNFMGNWADTDPFVAAADRLTATLTLTLAEGTYEFGFKFDGAWKANGANITRDANTANLATGEGNMHITADVAGEYVFVYTFATQELVVTYPVNALTIPEDAPVPTTAEEDVMAIFCNHYPNNNANFGISGWAGGYQILDLNGINVGYWTGMTWECIIDPAHTDDAHDFSAYKNIHVDLWAPLPAKIKFTAEAVNGGNYKDGQVVEMQQGWNSVDIAVADWAGNYDFKNLKCFVFEQYQTLAGESFEGNPFAFANIYFYGKEEQGVENVNDVVKAVKMIENGQVIIIKNGVKYNVMGARVR